jgi:hypothetical protein
MLLVHLSLVGAVVVLEQAAVVVLVAVQGEPLVLRLVVLVVL